MLPSFGGTFVVLQVDKGQCHDHSEALADSGFNPYGTVKLMRPLAYSDQTKRLLPCIGALVRAFAVVNNAHNAVAGFLPQLQLDM